MAEKIPIVPSYIFQKLFQSTVTYKYKGLPILCRPQDRCAITDVLLGRIYDPNNFGISFDWKKCRRIVDVGAHIGTFTVFAQAEAPDAIIESFEPSSIFEILENNAGRANIHKAAIADRNGTATFYEHKSGGASLVRKGSDADIVKIVPLGGVLSLTVDYLKMDCEGGEYDALYSLTRSETDNIKFLGLEYHHFSLDAGHRPQILFMWLLSRGFTIYLHKKSMLFAWHDPKPSLIALQSYYDSLP